MRSRTAFPARPATPARGTPCPPAAAGRWSSAHAVVYAPAPDRGALARRRRWESRYRRRGLLLLGALAVSAASVVVEVTTDIAAAGILTAVALLVPVAGIALSALAEERFTAVAPALPLSEPWMLETADTVARHSSWDAAEAQEMLWQAARVEDEIAREVASFPHGDRLAELRATRVELAMDLLEMSAPAVRADVVRAA